MSSPRVLLTPDSLPYLAYPLDHLPCCLLCSVGLRESRTYIWLWWQAKRCTESQDPTFQLAGLHKRIVITTIATTAAAAAATDAEPPLSLLLLLLLRPLVPCPNLPCATLLDCFTTTTHPLPTTATVYDYLRPANQSTVLTMAAMPKTTANTLTSRSRGRGNIQLRCMAESDAAAKPVVTFRLLVGSEKVGEGRKFKMVSGVGLFPNRPARSSNLNRFER